MTKDQHGASDTSAGEAKAEVEIELDPRIQAALGLALKAHYDDLVSAPIPDRFLALLAELEAKEGRHGG